MKQAPGIADVASREILAEIGPTLDSFRKDTALVAWSGLCPGNNESAGETQERQKSGTKASSEDHYDRGGLGGDQEEGLLLQGQVLPSQGPQGGQESHCGDCAPDSFGYI